MDTQRMRALAERETRPPGGGRALRPLDESRTAEIAYVRPHPTGDHPPVVLLPGGPGVASIVPYRAQRRRATQRGLDVLMMEHRGVGLSRHDTTGTDLPVEQVTVEAAADDLAAVLDDISVERAVVYGRPTAVIWHRRSAYDIPTESPAWCSTPPFSRLPTWTPCAPTDGDSSGRATTGPPPSYAN
ncbi:hypothetical protein [Saccharomonospora sp.]|uniref:hypothetical protein n=1 Tax=Saccharomonospora sp. TaxID=33913 RepID=UPI00261427A1|nr:hypothetical protein [Saccharomonospora sp.]